MPTTKVKECFFAYTKLSKFVATMKKRILLVYTGGTIGMTKDYDTNSLRAFDFENISERIPELALINADLSVISFDYPIDSSEISPKDWKKIGGVIFKEYENYDGFVVLHGTDTMAYTASALSFMLEGLRKPVIFTGSQLPIGELRTDAKENLISSIHYAALENEGGPVVQEVCIYFEYKLLRANRTTKLSTQHFDAFKSPNYPILGESGLNMNMNTGNLFQTEHASLNLISNFCEDVGLLKIFPGMSDEFLNQILNTPQLKALIIEAYGSGNIFNRPDFSNLLKQKSEEGMLIIIGTQCISGNVELGLYSASQPFLDANAISAKDMTTETALVKAMFLLGNKEIYTDIRRDFRRNLRGECSSN